MVIFGGAVTGFAPANSLLSSILEAVNSNNTRVVLYLPGGVPKNWRVNGEGSETVTITLPKTRLGPGVHLDKPQAGPVKAFVTTPDGDSLQIAIHLSSPLPVIEHSLPSALILEFGPAVHAPDARDRDSPPTSRNYTVIVLKYADVAEVANLLSSAQLQPTDIFRPASSAFALPSSTGGSSGPSVDTSSLLPQQTAAERLNDTVAIDRRLNALILSGSIEQVASIRDLVSQIDIPVDSVMLDCKVVELTSSSARDLGLDFSQASSGPVGQATFTTGTNASNGISGSQFNASFAAQLYATIAKGGGKILATPRVLAMDGRPAQILAGEAIPIVQSTIYPGSSAVTQESTSYVTVGINLEILPRIRGDGNVEAQTYAEVSSVEASVATSQGSVPEVSLRRASTATLVHDGTPFVIAGLLQDNEIANMSKIPIFGDLPLIGGLFRSTHTSTQSTNLYIVVTPHIVKTGP